MVGFPSSGQNTNRMPHNLCQWLAYIFVVVGGVIVSWGTQSFFRLVFLDPIKLAQKAHKRVKDLEAKLAKELGEELPEEKVEPKWQFGHLGTGLQGWVGAIGIIIYASSVVFGHLDFIAVWFATKYVAAYKTWAEEPVGRTFYNRSLFGSGLNILIGFFTGTVALWAIWRVGPH